MGFMELAEELECKGCGFRTRLVTHIVTTTHVCHSVKGLPDLHIHTPIKELFDLYMAVQH